MGAELSAEYIAVAELYVCGAMMQWPGVVADHNLKPGDFSAPNVLLFETLLDTYKAGRPVDPVSLYTAGDTRFKAQYPLDYLGRIHQSAVSDVNLQSYIAVLQAGSYRRTALQLLEDARKAIDRGESIQHYLDDLQRAPTSAAAYPLHFMVDLLASPQQVSWVIPGYLQRNTLTQVVGREKIGKTFILLDMCFAVCTGLKWNNINVEPGPVVYLAGEGYQGIRRRGKAWSIYHTSGINQFLLPEKPFALIDDLSCEQVKSAIDKRLNQSPSIIVIDTFARNLGGADENSTKDMNKAIANADRFFRLPYGAAVVVVHHVPHDKERARGSGALPGAIDNGYLVRGSETGGGSMIATHAKDTALAPPVAWDLVTVELGDDWGGTSAVCRITEYSQPKPNVGTGRNQKLILKALDKLGGEAEQDAVHEATGLERRRYYRARDLLIEKGVIEVYQGRMTKL